MLWAVNAVRRGGRATGSGVRLFHPATAVQNRNSRVDATAQTVDQCHELMASMPNWRYALGSGVEILSPPRDHNR